MTTYKFNNETMPSIVRKGEGAMEKEELQRIVSGLLSDAQSLAIDELASFRTKATGYYNGEALGNEEAGRSQVVITEVRDQILGIKPSFMRKFFGPDRVVEFIPTNEAQVPYAQQATDYVHHVFEHKCNGFRIVSDLADDGLIRRLGIAKWGWVEGKVCTYHDEDLTTDEVFKIAARDDVTVLEKPESNGKDGDEARFSIRYQVQEAGGVQVWSLAPETWFIDREATSIEDATFCGHGTDKTTGELIAMGVDEKIIKAHGGTLATLEFSADKVQRTEKSGSNNGQNPDAGEGNDLHFFVEGYYMLDVEGTGVPSLYKVLTLGPGHYPVFEPEPAYERPFSLFTPIPEAHALIGLSHADLTMDLQYIKSNLTRGMLDSFALSIYPRMAFLEGYASAEDILNTEIGAPIRTKRENAVQSFSHPFTGEKAMGLLEYFDAVGESRTGRNKGAMSLDADALQSSTQSAVTGALQASQERTDLLCRMFAEQCLKPMFMGIYRLMVHYNPEKELIKLRGDYVPIDVASWDADYTCTVQVGLGVQTNEQRIALLQSMALKQEAIMAGGSNPMVSLAQLRYTYARILELGGEYEISSFFKPVPTDYEPPPPPPPPPSPEQVISQAQLEIERMKITKEIAIKEAELQLKRDEQEWNHSFQVMKLAEDSTIRRYQIDAQFHASHTQMMEQLDAAADETAMRTIIETHKLRHDNAKAVANLADAQEQRQHEVNQTDAQHAHEASIAASEPAPAAGE